MAKRKPNVVIIGGPNGAGKTTLSTRVLHGALRVDEFVNADIIAKGLSAFDPEGVALEAGRIMLKRLRGLAAARADFAFETTLASRTFAPWVAGLRESGYAFHLIYVWVPSADLSVLRVGQRVKLGGHFVPDDTVRRRYAGGLRNFFELFRPIADTWRCYDNSGVGGPKVVASGKGQSRERVYQQATWETIVEAYRRAKAGGA